jgi:hypothetical protein
MNDDRLKMEPKGRSLALAKIAFCFLMLVTYSSCGFARSEKENTMNLNRSLIFGTFAETEEQLQHAFYLAESVREFSGKYKESPIWIYIPEDLEGSDKPLMENIKSLGAEIKASGAPEEALRYYFARKVYAAGKAESEAQGTGDILVWMDEDTIVLGEPADVELKDGIDFAYRPVMHNRSGSLFSEPPGPFWSRIYEILSIEDSSLFPMVTPADRQTIRAYFNAGLLVVRPQSRILRRWGEDFTSLYSDSVLADMCANDIERKIFIHQTALVGAVLNHLRKDNLMELSDRYNYPIFFHQQYEAAREFGSIEDIITLRYDVYFRNPDPDWSAKLKGPSRS